MIPRPWIRNSGRAKHAYMPAPAPTVITISRSVTGHLLGAEASYDLVAPERRWVPVVGVGLAAAWVQAVGTTLAPRESVSSATWLWGPTLRLGLGCTLTRGLRLRADALALVVTAPTSIGVAGRAIGQWGQPTLLFSISLETLLAF